VQLLQILYIARLRDKTRIIKMELITKQKETAVLLPKDELTKSLFIDWGAAHYTVEKCMRGILNRRRCRAH
jgi:hypothetical protein